MFYNDLSTLNGSTGASEHGKLVYNVSHEVDVLHKSTGTSSKRNVWMRIFERADCVVINLNDADQFMFNYSREIGRGVFEGMKSDQCLTIAFEEFCGQIVELLSMTSKQQMFVRLEVENTQCRVVFYEMSKIKALIFLVIELHVTSEKELICELVKQIKGLKGTNSNLQQSLVACKQMLTEKDTKLREVNNRYSCREFLFLKELNQIDRSFSSSFQAIQGTFENRLNAYNKRLSSLLKDLDSVKHCNTLKSESSNRLMNSMQELRLDNDQNLATIETLRKQIERLTESKHESDEAFLDANAELKEKDKAIGALQAQLKELQNDIQKSTSVIKNLQTCNDDLSKDLFKANQMLVSYNKHYDNMSKTNEELQEEINKREGKVKELSQKLKELTEEFDSYSTKFSPKEIGQLQSDLHVEKTKNGKLEKKIREVEKLNELLSSKLAGMQSSSGEGKYLNHCASNISKNISSNYLGSSDRRHNS